MAMTSTGIRVGVSLPYLGFILPLFHSQPPLNKIKHFFCLISPIPNSVLSKHSGSLTLDSIRKSDAEGWTVSHLLH